jgi:hypothetical protein
MYTRLLFSAILLFSVLFLPFYITGLIALGGILVFPMYIEAVVMLLISDLLFGTLEPRFFGVLFVSSGLGLVALLVLESLKKKIKFYGV